MLQLTMSLQKGQRFHKCLHALLPSRGHSLGKVCLRDDNLPESLIVSSPFVHNFGKGFRVMRSIL